MAHLQQRLLLSTIDTPATCAPAVTFTPSNSIYGTPTTVFFTTPVAYLQRHLLPIPMVPAATFTPNTNGIHSCQRSVTPASNIYSQIPMAYLQEISTPTPLPR